LLASESICRHCEGKFQQKEVHNEKNAKRNRKIIKADGVRSLKERGAQKNGKGGRRRGKAYDTPPMLDGEVSKKLGKRQRGPDTRAIRESAL